MGLDLAEGLAVCFDEEGVEDEASAFLFNPGMIGGVVESSATNVS